MKDSETEFEIGDLTIVVFTFSFELGVLLTDGLQFCLLGGESRCVWCW